MASTSFPHPPFLIVNYIQRVSPLRVLEPDQAMVVEMAISISGSENKSLR